MEVYIEKDKMDRKLMKKVVNTMSERRFNLLQHNEELRESTYSGTGCWTLKKIIIKPDRCQ
jgi:hypothetical protein